MKCDVNIPKLYIKKCLKVFMKWNKIKDLGLPWSKNMNEAMKNTVLPQLSGEMLFLASDYGGNHKRSDYYVYSVLIADWQYCVNWEYNRKIVRKKYLKDNRRMSFKGLNDFRKRKALVPFLEASDYIHGICCNLIQTKKLKNPFFDNKKYRRINDISEKYKMKGKWNPKSLDRMWMIVNFIAMLIAGFAKERQHIYWISDEDDIFANENKAEDVKDLLSALTTMYVEFELGELGIGTTKLDEGDRIEEDLVALADLAAGSLSEFATKISRKLGGRLYGGLFYEIPKGLSKKTELIISWLGDKKDNLYKQILMIEEAEKGQFGLAKITIE